ncbi:Hypothetical protein, putative [Bodo saltans]|uniref:Uncharacterized protein n=1 Tax=Bodo saltans TaxID=75058 RepID=A0A0S4IVD5_BODSA|nr:Hypothetical protein, putative [Bodo saltans]|eukprot:CUG03912.1 Hypothetical protein, putative [Bodo saltans]
MDEASAQGQGQQNETNNNVVMPVFDLEARSWAFRSTFGDVPCARCHHVSVVYELMDEASAQGQGQQNETNNNVVMPVFDLEARSWAFRSTFGDVPCARCHHVSVVYGDTLMVHGGYPILSGQQKELTAEEMSSMQHTMFDVHELSITTLRWRRISTAQSPSLWGHSAVAFNKNVIVFGGVDVVENTETGAVAVWHQEKKLWRWADFQNLDLKCAMHTAALDGSRMLIFGGVSFKTQKKLRSLYEFNLEFGTWRELNPRGQMPEGRIGHAVVTFQQNMIVIGGSIEGDSSNGDGSLTSSSARFDRKIYVFNSQTSDWRSMQISVNATGDLGDGRTASPGAASSAQTPGQQRLNPTNAAWSINKSRNQTADESDWDATANRVRDTLTRAKAIQQLADTAADALNHQQQYDEQGGQAAQRQEGPQASLQRLQRQADPNVSFEYHGNGGGQYQQQQDPETRRMLEHLKRENDTLRKQLEEFRNLSLNQGAVNPYEVPVYNTAAGVVPENESLASPGRSRGHARLEGNSALTELAPRLNINVAEPPRAVGGGSSGYMSRSAVSALVNSSLRDQPASTSLAANLRAAASMDPMSYLTQTPHVAAFQQNASSFGHAALPGSYQAPRTYEELFGRRGGALSSSDPGSFSQHALQASIPRNEAMPPVPNSLKPLLSILTGGMIPGTSIPQQFGASGTQYGQSAPQGGYNPSSYGNNGAYYDAGSGGGGYLNAQLHHHKGMIPGTSIPQQFGGASGAQYGQSAPGGYNPASYSNNGTYYDAGSSGGGYLNAQLHHNNASGMIPGTSIPQQFGGASGAQYGQSAPGGYNPASYSNNGTYYDAGSSGGGYLNAQLHHNNASTNNGVPPGQQQFGAHYSAARTQHNASQQALDSSLQYDGHGHAGHVTPRRANTGSLSKLVNGQGSMLSLGMLQ